MTETLTKLVALWPKGSEWQCDTVGTVGNIRFWLKGTTTAYFISAAGSDTSNAPARNIIEDALIELGCRKLNMFQRGERWVYLAGLPREWLLQGVLSRTEGGEGATRTEALLDLAVKVLEAHAPHP